MINILIADDNILYAINLMNSINMLNSNIKVCGIAKDGKVTLEKLNELNNIDIVLLDIQMPFYSGLDILNKISNKQKYAGSIIVLTAFSELASVLYNNEMVYSIINKTSGKNRIIREINNLVKYKEEAKNAIDLRLNIYKEVSYLGYNIALKGTEYLIQAIEEIVNTKNYSLENLEKNVYTKLSKKYNKSVHIIKVNINSATMQMYCNCDVEKLKRYFLFSKDEKPKVKVVIGTILNKIINNF